MAAGFGYTSLAYSVKSSSAVSAASLMATKSSSLVHLPFDDSVRKSAIITDISALQVFEVIGTICDMGKPSIHITTLE